MKWTKREILLFMLFYFSYHSRQHLNESCFHLRLFKHLFKKHVFLSLHCYFGIGIFLASQVLQKRTLRCELRYIKIAEARKPKSFIS